MNILCELSNEARNDKVQFEMNWFGLETCLSFACVFKSLSPPDTTYHFE